MKVVILAGGFGTRISEESHLIPKPMITIGERPVLCHIMAWYSHFGFNDFVICAGYKQDVIKEYFFNYYLHNSDVTFDLSSNEMKVHRSHSETWKVTVVDTGLGTMTGGRIKRIRDYIGDESFMLTYGDGVSDINLAALESFHREHGKTVTISAYTAAPQFGMLEVGEGDQVTGFREKNIVDSSLINIGYMVCEPGIFRYLEGDGTVLEKEPMESLARDGELVCRKHNGFWQCMDTMRDRKLLEDIYARGDAPWIPRSTDASTENGR